MDALLDVHRLRARLADHEFHAPVTIDVEVVQALRRRWLVRVLDDAEAAAALMLFRAIAISRHSVEPLVPRIWSLRHNITAYDASYVALAESLGVALITRDRRLAQSSGHTARIEYIA